MYENWKENIKMWLEDPTRKVENDIVSPKLTKAYKHQAIIKYFTRFDEKVENQEHEFYDDGYHWRISRRYVPEPGSKQVTEKDAEYHISANNFRYCTKKSDCRSYYQYVYVGLPGYLNYECSGYKTIPGTIYRV